VLQQLRQILAPRVDLWVGGMGVRRLAVAAGVVPLPTLEAALSDLNAWRAEHP